MRAAGFVACDFCRCEPGRCAKPADAQAKADAANAAADGGHFDCHGCGAPVAVATCGGDVLCAACSAALLR